MEDRERKRSKQCEILCTASQFNGLGVPNAYVLFLPSNLWQQASGSRCQKAPSWPIPKILMNIHIRRRYGSCGHSRYSHYFIHESDLTVWKKNHIALLRYNSRIYKLRCYTYKWIGLRSCVRITAPIPIAIRYGYSEASHWAICCSIESTSDAVLFSFSSQ